MPASPRVSAVITTYNRAEFLVEAINSVLAQSYADVELIVADDGSTDETAAVAARYAERLRFLPLTHTGRPEDMRNAAIRVADGELIAFLDDDDRWREDKLARQVAVFDADPQVHLVYSDAQLIWPDGTISGAVLSEAQKAPASVFTLLLEGNFIHPSTVIVKKALFDQMGLFEQRFFGQADYHFWLRAAAVFQVRCVAEPLTQVRRHAQNISQLHNLQLYLHAVEVLTDVCAGLPLTWSRRLLAQRTLARWHTHIGLALQAQEPDRAHAYFRRSLRLNPLQRRAWQALLARG